MHHYMEFMEECERLKDLFLLEGTEDAAADGGDDLSEMTPEEDSGDEEKEGDDALASEDDPEEGESDDDIDLDLDSDLGDLTGDDSLEPEADEVNAEEKPGAINPATLYQEITQGDDNIYDRTAKSALEKFPSGKCEVKDMLPIIAIGIKSYMKNKNYAPLPKIDMKRLVFRIAHDIHDKLTGQKEESKPVAEAVFYQKDMQTLTEGWKELALAGAIAAAPMAGHAATAESAPYNTHQGTSKIITNNRSMSQDSREMVHTRDNYGGKVGGSVQSSSGKSAKAGKQVGKTSTPAKQGGGSSEVPVVSDYSKVSFDEGTTYQVTPEQLKKMQADGNVPANYQILSSSAPAGSGDKVAKASSSSSGKSATAQSGKSAKSVTQDAAKAQAKAQAKAPSGRCPVDAERCGCGGEDEDIDWKKTTHKLAHDATDAALTLGGTAVDAVKKVPGTLGKIGGFLKRSFLNNKAELEKEHDEMIADRNK